MDKPNTMQNMMTGVTGVDRLSGEIEQRFAIPPLEDPDQHTEGSGNGEDVHGDGFDGNDDRANLKENQQHGRNEDEGERTRKLSAMASRLSAL